MVDRQCPGGFNYKRYKRNAALNAAFFFACYLVAEQLTFEVLLFKLSRLFISLSAQQAPTISAFRASVG
jgi:hypothetical protein